MSYPVLVPHPMEWWTKDPLRLDSTGDLMLGQDKISASDYRTEMNVTRIGTIAGHRILQLILTIYPGQRPIDAGYAPANTPPAQWKSILVQTGATSGADAYVELYRLQDYFGLYMPVQPAKIYRSGANAVSGADAILGTFDAATGNGGTCTVAIGGSTGKVRTKSISGHWMQRSAKSFQGIPPTLRGAGRFTSKLLL